MGLHIGALKWKLMSMYVLSALKQQHSDFSSTECPLLSVSAS